jgi:septal ring factor EnvC (AmiA/AmiB activator)
MAQRTTRTRRTAEDIRMARAEHDRDIEDVVAERDELAHKLDVTIEQSRQALEEVDRLYRDQISKLRAELAHKTGENEALQRYIALVQNDQSVASHFAAGAKAGLEHIERQAAALLETVRAIHEKANEAADHAHEQGELEREEQAQLPPPMRPLGAPGTRAGDDTTDVPSIVNRREENQ